MKKSILLLIISIFNLSLTLQSQNYFYDEDRPLALVEDQSNLVIHFAEEASFESFLKNIPEAWILKKSISTYLMVVVETNTEQDLENLPLLSNLQIRNLDYEFQLEDGFPLWLSHELLFEPKNGIDISQSSVSELLDQLNGEIFKDEFGKYHIEFEDPSYTLSFSNLMVEEGLVRWAHPDFYANHTKYNDPLYNQQFQMNNTGQTISGSSGQADVDCDGPEAWAITTGAASITVAVIDDGLESHPDLTTSSGSSRVLSGFTPANNGNGTPASSNDAHGMACAGIVAASHNNIGVRGVAPEVRLKSVNIFQGGETTSDLANAFTWAKNQGADVMSNSWGYTSCTLSLSSLNSAINDARLNGRGGDGCVIIFAAGNGYKSCVDYPADLTTVMAVGAVTNGGAHSNYSNEGPALDIVAPSNPAPGQAGAGVRTIDRTGSAGYSSGNYTSGFGGTSAACPVVSGAAALLLSYNPNLSESQVRTFLENSATNMGPAGFDNTFGHGRVSAYDALIFAGAGNDGCSTTINSFPYSEGFESGLGDWSQGFGDEIDWTQQSGETPSNNTGPNSASEGQFYLFVESSSPNYPSKTAALNSPCLDVSNLVDPAIRFDYNMFGGGIGTLDLQASTDNGNSWTSLWTLSGNQSAGWNPAEVSLLSFSNETELTLRFVATTGSNWDGDIAIDNVLVDTESDIIVNPNPCDLLVSTFPFNEGFENGLSNWVQTAGDDMDWVLGSGGTPSNGTGPSSAAEGSNYLFIEATSPNFPSKTGIITSPCFDLTNLNNPALRFAYNMNGSAMGTLTIEVSADNENWVEIWTESGNQGFNWLETEVGLGAFSNAEELKIRLIGSTATSFTSDMSIDAIELGEESDGNIDITCSSNITSLPYNESFEDLSSDWSQITNDDIDWTRRSGSTPSSLTGPSSAFDGSFYYYVEASSPNFPNKSARLESPCFDLSAVNQASLNFAYHMTGSAVGTLLLEARSESGDWVVISSYSGDQGSSWNEANIDLSSFIGESTVQFRFTGTTANSWQGDIAIDAITVAAGGDPGATNPCPQINFSGQIESFGGSQDAGSASVTNGGNNLLIEGNAWKSMDFNYTVTANTQIEVEFRSTGEGEIHGIGFDNDNAISSNLSFQFYGTQSWGIQNFNNYSGSSWQSYSIPVGDFFTGTFSKLVFVGDNDSGTGENSRFRNLKIFEDGDCNPTISQSNLTALIPIHGHEPEIEYSEKLTIFPNPANDIVHLVLSNLGEDRWIRITDITGKQVATQRINSTQLQLDITNYPSGLYIIQLMGVSEVLQTQKLIKTN